MKKIFTLFAVVVMALSSFATTPLVSRTAQLPKRAPKARQLADLQLLERNKATIFPENLSAPPVKSLASAATTGDTIRLDFDHFAVLPQYDLELRTWFMSAMTENEEWIVKFDFYGSSDGYAGTYTEDDLRYDYSYIFPPDYAPAVYYEDITLKVEDVVTDYLHEIRLHADILASDGNVYIVNITHQTFFAKNTIEYFLPEAYLARDFDHFTITGKDSNYDLYLKVDRSNPISAWGPYDRQDFDLTQTHITYQGVEQVINQPEITIQSIQLDDGQFAWNALFSYFNQDTTQHIIHITAPMPPAIDTVEITCPNLVIDESWAEWLGWVQFYGQDETYDVYCGYVGTYFQTGTYEGENAMLYVTEMASWYEVEALYTTLTVSENPLSGNGYDVDITAYGSDYKAYKIHMTYTVPEPTREVDIQFENSALAFFDPTINKLQLENENDQYFCAINLVDVHMGDQFTSDNVNPLGIFLYDEYNNRVDVGDIYGSVYLQGDTTVVDATILGFDAVQYNVKMWYAVPVPTDTVNLFITDADFFNEMKSLGFYQVYGYTDDNLYTVTFGINSTVVPGTYGIDGTFGTMTSPDGYYDLLGGGYTYVSKVTNPALEEFEVYTVEKAILQVEMDADQDITIYATVICSNAVCYNITMTTKYDKPHLAYDEEDEAIDRTFTEQDRLVIIDETETFGRIYFDVEAADGFDLFAVYFFANEADPETVVPAGRYTFNYSQAPGSMLANMGVTGDGRVAPSYYATTNGHGLLDRTWLITSGTTEVKKVNGKLYFEINALNSYDVPIHIVYDATDKTSVEQVPVPSTTATKSLRDGQLFIHHDGHTYTLMGVQL